MTRRESAPAKVNLVLHVGPAGGNGLHPLCSLFASVTLADEVVVEEAASDEVVCEGVEETNLAGTALEAFRAAVPGSHLPPLHVTIEKRIPLVAGLGGGSADAAAVLRIANELAGDPLDAGALRRLAATLGSDVPSQVEPAHAVVSGLGEVVERVELPALALVLVPQEQGLPTGDVYAELDRLRSRGQAAQRERLDGDALKSLAAGPVGRLAAGMENDLEAAALSLRPELREPLAALRELGALSARVTGSGPTVFGLFSDTAAAEEAAAAFPAAIVTETRT